MEIVEDIAAVRRRIAQISSYEQPSEAFGETLQQRLQSPSTIASVARADVEALARRSGSRYDVKPELIEAIVSSESGFERK